MEKPIQITKEALEIFINKLHKEDETVQGVLVVKSKETENDFTYKITSKQKQNYKSVSIYQEVEYNRFNYLYTINKFTNKYDKDIYKYSKVYAGAVWLLNNLFNKKIDNIMDKAILYNTGKCIKCNRTLTDAESIEFGMGRTCREK